MQGRLPALVAVALVGFLTGCDGTQYRTPYVQSLLEERRHDVVVQKWDLSCGAAALATLLTYDLGHPTTEREIAAVLLKRYQNIGQVQMQLGFSLLDLKAYAQRVGFKAAGYGDMTLHDLVTMAPVIVPIHVNGFNHFVIFRQVRGSRVLVADPAFGNRTMQLDYFASVWRDHIAFRVTPRHGHPATRWTRAQPQDFWATSRGNEPVARSVLALEQQAAGKVEVAANRTAPPAAKPVATATAQPPAQPPAPVRYAAKADATLRHVTAAGDPNEPQPVTRHRAERNIGQAMAVHADWLERHGDIAGARWLYRQAALLGDGAAAAALARTYDPADHAAYPDIAKALEWYLKAVKQGDPAPAPRVLEIVTAQPSLAAKFTVSP